jgi:hypothetical protein
MSSFGIDRLFKRKYQKSGFYTKAAKAEAAQFKRKYVKSGKYSKKKK